MSDIDDDDQGEEQPMKNLDEVKEEVAQKLLESFSAVDTEGTG